MRNYYIDDQRLQLLKYFINPDNLGNSPLFLKNVIPEEMNDGNLSLLHVFIDTLDQLNLSFNIFYQGSNIKYLRIIDGFVGDSPDGIDIVVLWRAIGHTVQANETMNFVIFLEEYNIIFKKIAIFIEDYLEMNYNNSLYVKGYQYYDFDRSKNIFIDSIKDMDLSNKTKRTFIIEKEIYKKTKFDDFEPSKYLFIHTLLTLNKYNYIDIHNCSINNRGMNELKSIGKANITIKDKFIEEYGSLFNPGSINEKIKMDIAKTKNETFLISIDENIPIEIFPTKQSEDNWDFFFELIKNKKPEDIDDKNYIYNKQGKQSINTKLQKELMRVCNSREPIKILQNNKGIISFLKNIKTRKVSEKDIKQYKEKNTKILNKT